MICHIKDFEYSHVISDVISELLKADNFVMQIWVDGTELPFTVTDEEDVEFLKEAIKISHEHSTEWVLYGIIRSIKVIR